MRIWLDDIRPPPDAFGDVVPIPSEIVDPWVWVRTSQDCISILANCSADINEISFDHDLGMHSHSDGGAVANHIEYLVCVGKIISPIKWSVHSMNPIGRERIARTMEAVDRLFK